MLARALIAMLFSLLKWPRSGNINFRVRPPVACSFVCVQSRLATVA
jgi:hypothetical protein